MKYLILIFATFTIFPSRAQNIRSGDNLQNEFKKIDKPYYFKAPAFTGWIEGSDMMLIGARPNANDCGFLFIALKDTTLIGVFKNTPPNVFLFDTEGNSVVSEKSEFFFLPLWIVKNNARIVAADKKILDVLDELYEQTMQADNGQPDEKTVRAYQQFQADTTLANRHIALLFDNYQTILSETAAKGQQPPSAVCVPLMKTLAGECLSLYNEIPAIVCIYMGEALLSANMIGEARTHFKASLQFYPNSIPLLVYNYRLEQDAEKKKQQLAKLKKDHGKHWMVKDL